MAASTANMVKSQAGELFEASSPQGKMIVTAATTGKDADFDSTTQATESSPKMDMLQTLTAIYEETQESGDTLDDIEEILDEDGNPLDDARKNLKKSNKDKRKFKLTEGIKKASRGVKAGFGKAKETLSGKLGLALLGGGLVLLNQYGDEIAGPNGWLTRFLKYMKENFIPDMKALYETITGDGGLIAGLKEGWDKTWVQITALLTFLKEIGDKIQAYIKSFDMDGDGSLDADEMKNLQDDLVDKAGKLVATLIDSIWSNINKYLVAAFAVTGVASVLIQGYIIRRIAMQAAAAATAATLAAAGAKPPPSGGKGPNTRGSARPSVFRGALKSLAVGTSAFSGTAVGATRANAALAQGTRLNSANRLINSQTGQYVKGSFAHLSKYPRLMSAARKIPLLGPILSGVLAYNVMTNDELDKDEKITQMGGILGGALGAAAFGTIGAAIGALGFGVGAIPGGLIGSLAGFYGGEWAGTKLMGILMGKEREPMDIPLQSASTLGSMLDTSTGEVITSDAAAAPATGTSSAELVSVLPRPDKNFFGGDRQGVLWDEKYGMTHNTDGSVISKAPLTMDAQLREADAAGAQRHALKSYLESIAANTEIMANDELLKKNQLIAQQDAKNLMREMKDDAAKKNQFTTYTSQDRRTSTEINQANFVDSITARNEFWQEYYMHKAAN